MADRATTCLIRPSVRDELVNVFFSTEGALEKQIGRKIAFDVSVMRSGVRVDVQFLVGDVVNDAVKPPNQRRQPRPTARQPQRI